MSSNGNKIELTFLFSVKSFEWFRMQNTDRYTHAIMTIEQDREIKQSPGQNEESCGCKACKWYSQI